MKHFRILAAMLLMIVLGSAFAFADVIDIPVPRTDNSQVIAIVVAVVVIIVAIVLLRALIKRRRLKNDGMEPEEPNDINIR